MGEEGWGGEVSKGTPLECRIEFVNAVRAQSSRHRREREVPYPWNLLSEVEGRRIVRRVELRSGEDVRKRVSDELDEAITRESEVRGKSWSAMTRELLEEAIRMRRIPGIAFADGPAGRRAVVGGSGLDVWEVVATWKAVDKNHDRLRQSYHWLTEVQLRAALAYYEVYPEEIDARLEREAQWTPERVRREFPFSRPRNA
ncbi:MAG TPA: hypothetical protein VLT87_07485 [Thermoanaerobaculia bacterium]|nr:hypothetical protein [Thermoanaerobaculia bacterium]